MGCRTRESLRGRRLYAAFVPTGHLVGDAQGRRDFLRGLSTHSNPTLKFYNEELFIYKCCYILYIFYKMNIK